LSLFGFLGVIYGPIIVIFFVTTIEIYLQHYRIPAVQPVESTAEQTGKFVKKRGAQISRKGRSRRGI
jgi:hypothetical protein